ncbi:MAG: hypothetical protein LBT65_08615 [Synergistaceae bacterium]|jgi:hypothetical protein|nr:hypothetical protein [Synergistaceae bacterium]
MWDKPESENLLPVFMHETTGLVAALAVYFGIPVLLTLMLLRYHDVTFALILPWYLNTLYSIFNAQSIFYIIHLAPACAIRVFLGKRPTAKTAFLTALLLDLLAILIVYPARSLLNPRILKNIFIFAGLSPLLMTFFTLRIHRLRFAGGIVILVFLCLLYRKLFYFMF